MQIKLFSFLKKKKRDNYLPYKKDDILKIRISVSRIRYQITVIKNHRTEL